MMPSILAAAAVEAAEGGFVEKFGLDAKLVIFQLVGFLIFFVVVYKYGIKPIVAKMEERNKGIADGLRYADEMKAKLADAEKQHAATLRQAALDAQKVVDEARKSAKELLDREAAATTEKTQQMLAKAEEAIALERRKMIADARVEITRLVALTAQRVLSRELGPEERKRYTETAARDLADV
jgi:F-type H+-transporting ATPase subunit b